MKKTSMQWQLAYKAKNGEAAFIAWACDRNDIMCVSVKQTRY